MAFPGNYNFSYYRGDTYEFTVQLKNQNGDDFPLNEYENILFKIAERRGSTTQFTGVTEKILPSTIKCTITSTVGRNLASGNYVYDIQITDTTADPDIIYTVLTGTIRVTPDISGSI